MQKMSVNGHHQGVAPILDAVTPTTLTKMMPTNMHMAFSIRDSYLKFALAS